MGGNKRILLVEDNAHIRELFALLLRRTGYEVIEAADGVEALDQTRMGRPDLIVMDLGLPDITGDEVTARLKADPSSEAIPVLINTAFPKGSLPAERAIAAGAARILYKPTDPGVLLETVQRLLSLPQARRTVVDPSSLLRKTPEATCHPDIASPAHP